MGTGQSLAPHNPLQGMPTSPVNSPPSNNGESQMEEIIQRQTEGEGAGALNGKSSHNPLRAISTTSSLFMPPSAVAVCSAIRADTFRPGTDGVAAALPSPPTQYAEIRREPDGELVGIRQGPCIRACPGRFTDMSVFRRLYTGMIASADTVEGLVEGVMEKGSHI